jgi:hypothetical protein
MMMVMTVGLLVEVLDRMVKVEASRRRLLQYE